MVVPLVLYVLHSSPIYPITNNSSKNHKLKLPPCCHYMPLYACLVVLLLLVCRIIPISTIISSSSSFFLFLFFICCGGISIIIRLLVFPYYYYMLLSVMLAVEGWCASGHGSIARHKSSDCYYLALKKERKETQS